MTATFLVKIPHTQWTPERKLIEVYSGFDLLHCKVKARTSWDSSVRVTFLGTGDLAAKIEKEIQEEDA